MPEPKIIAMIPARLGSTRLAKKNLALLHGKPLIYYAIKAAQDSGAFDRIVLNSEDAAFAEIALRYGVSFYQRPKELGTSQTRSDEVVNDFMQHHPGDLTAWVNSTSPLQTGEEIRRVVDYFFQNDLDSLITVREENVHCLLGGRPLNFCEDEPFARTQDLQPVQRFVYSAMMWRNRAFLKSFRNKGHALFCGKIGYFPVSKEAALIVKTEEDLRLIEYILTGKESRNNYKIEYGE